MITPQEILDKTFTVHWLRKGYAQKEVDDFLDMIGADVAKLRDMASGFKAVQPVAAQPAAEPVPTWAQGVANVLQHAQTTADQIVNDAKQAATVTAATAETQAKQLIEQARADALTGAEEAKTEAAKIVAALQSQAQDLEQKIAGLRGTHADVSAKLQNALTALAPAPDAAAAVTPTTTPGATP